MTAIDRKFGTTGRLADDFYFMLHDDVSGRPRLPERIVGLGLAGALLCELAARRMVTVKDGCVSVPAWTPTSDGFDGADDAGDLARGVLDQVRREKPRPVRDWLAHLGRDAAERVAERLHTAHLLYFKRSQLPWWPGPGRWVPVNDNIAALPAVQVCGLLIADRPDTRTILLAGLTRATGLIHPMLWEVRGLLEDQQFLHWLLDPLDPSLRDLLARVETAVGAAVASHRT